MGFWLGSQEMNLQSTSWENHRSNNFKFGFYWTAGLNTRITMKIILHIYFPIHKLQYGVEVKIIQGNMVYETHPSVFQEIWKENVV